MSALILVAVLVDVALFLFLFWAARPRVGADHGPFRLDERLVNRARRFGTCPYRSMDSEHLCTRRGGHWGIHDVKDRPLYEVLRRT